MLSSQNHEYVEGPILCILKGCSRKVKSQGVFSWSRLDLELLKLKSVSYVCNPKHEGSLCFRNLTGSYTASTCRHFWGYLEQG